MLTPDPDGIWPTKHHDLRTREEVAPEPLYDSLLEKTLRLVYAECPSAAPVWLGMWSKDRELARRAGKRAA